MRLLISGYYGFGNIGDEALLAGLVAGLKQRGFDDITVLSQRPALTAGQHGVESRHRLKGLLPALMRCDALISGGGGLLQDKTSYHSLLYYLMTLRLAALLGKRTVVYGQSVGPLSPWGRRRVAETLRRVPVAVRDEASLKLLAASGVRAELCADTALTLEKESTERTSADTVVFIPRAGYPEITALFGELARTLSAEGRRVAAMSLHPAEDDAELESLREQVAGLESYPASTHSDVLGYLAGSGYVVSARLHGLILAAVAKRPFSGVVYDPKVEAFLSASGRSIHRLPVEPAAILKEMRSPGLDEEKLESLKGRAEAGLDWLGAILGSSGD